MIRRIRIQNFKSIRDVTVDLSPVTVLVGKTGTGKTNFVTAIRFLRDLLALGPEQLGSFGNWQQLLHVAARGNPMGFEIEFEVPGYEESFQYTLVLHEGAPANPPRLECLKYGTKELFAQEFQDKKGTLWRVEPSLVVVPKAGPIALRRLPGLEQVVVAYTALSTGLGVYDFEANVLQDERSSNGRSGLHDDARNHLAVLKEIAQSLHDVNTRKGLLATMKRLNPSISSMDLDNLQSPRTVIVGHQIGSSKTLQLDLKAESSGVRRFYAHLLAIYQTPPKLTLIFEEPENGIYPGALTMLADEFKAAPDAGRGQVILTTHSPRLLDHFSSDQIRVVELIDMETKIGPLSQEQRAALDEQLLHAGELLTVDPARREGGPQ
jgi:predicted ATPase